MSHYNIGAQYANVVAGYPRTPGAYPMVHQPAATGGETTDKLKKFVTDNKWYLAGGAAIVLGAVAWHQGWFE